MLLSANQRVLHISGCVTAREFKQSVHLTDVPLGCKSSQCAFAFLKEVTEYSLIKLSYILSSGKELHFKPMPFHFDIKASLFSVAKKCLNESQVKSCHHWFGK